MLELLTNAQIFAPEPLGLRHLLVGGGRILWIGEGVPEVPTALGARVRDLEGRRVVPGLIDPHVHLTGGGGEAGAHTKVPPLSLSRFTRGGVTSIVALLGTDDATRHPRELVTAVQALRNEGLSAWCYTAGYHVPPVTITGSVRGDIATIDCIIGVKCAVSDHRSSQPTLDEFLRIASEAHVGGVMTGKAGIVHIHVGDGPRGLALIREALEHAEIPARAFNPTHVNRRKALFDEAIAVAKLGCNVDITAFPVAADEDAWPADVALVRYLDSGAPADRVTISSDGGGCLPVFDHHGRVAAMGVGDPAALAITLKALLAAGQPLERVLPAFTSNTANLLRLPRKGTIAEGNDADLVVLDPDGGVRDVMANGTWHAMNGHVAVAGTFETMIGSTA